MLPLRVTPEVSSPRGNSSTLGVSMPYGNPTLPYTPWQTPPGFSATPEALPPPLCLSHSRGLAGWFFRRQETPSLSLFSAPCFHPSPSASASSIMASKVALAPAASSPEPSYAPLSSDVPAVAVHVNPASPAPPAVLASSYDADSSISSPLHSALLAALSSVSDPTTRYPPPAPLSLAPAGGSYIALILPLIASATIVSVHDFFPIVALA